MDKLKVGGDVLQSMKPIEVLFPKPKRKKVGRTAWNCRIKVGKTKYKHLSIRKAGKKKKRSKLPKTPTLAKRKKYLWELCRKYTKLRDGKLCVSCKKRLASQCGHFLPKSACNIIYKYDEKNIGQQCSYCNLHLKGNYIEYRNHLIEVYGLTVVEEMERVYNLPLPYNFSPRLWVEKKIKWYEKETK